MTATPKMLTTLDFIRGYISDHGYAPTLNEIGEHFGISKVTAFDRLNRLEELRMIRRDKNHSRSIHMLTGDCPTCGRPMPKAKKHA